MLLPLALAMTLSACATRTDGPSGTGASEATTDTSGPTHITLPSLPDLPKLPHVPDLPSVPAIVTVKAATKHSGMTERVGHAAMTPLSDLNVVQQKIPDVLRHARTVGPYALPAKSDCPSVEDEINRLTAELGPDLDDPKLKGKANLLDRGADAAESYGVGIVRRTVEGLVPFRSWVRKLSGAEKHSSEVASAIVAGGVRRAYLKGIRRGMGCPAPGAQETRLDAAASPTGAAVPSAPSEPTPPASEPGMPTAAH